MNARDETDIDGDTRLISAMRELVTLPKFDLGEEIAAANRAIAEIQRARMADDCFCPVCHKRGVRNCNCGG